MANIMASNNGHPWRPLLWLLFTVIIFHLIPISRNSMNNIEVSRILSLIKWRPFIYVILNFIIIICIRISSSSFTHKLNNFINKVQKKSISSLISQTSLKFDDESWWFRVGNNESFTRLDESALDGNKEEKTVSFEPKTVSYGPKTVSYEPKTVSLEPKTVSYEPKKAEKVEEMENYENVNDEEEFATMDDTWKAIMDAKNKGGGPQLTKSGTWTAGDRGGGGGEVGKVEGERLTKCRTFSRDVVQGKKGRRVGGDGGGGRKKEKEAGLIFNDELKRRADAFIARVTYLQRMESDQRRMNKFGTREKGIKAG